MKKEEDNHDRFGLYSLRKINNKKLIRFHGQKKKEIIYFFGCIHLPIKTNHQSFIRFLIKKRSLSYNTKKTILMSIFHFTKLQNIENVVY